VTLMGRGEKRGGRCLTRLLMTAASSCSTPSRESHVRAGPHGLVHCLLHAQSMPASPNAAALYRIC
jgi:hypothetical protein